MIDIESQVYTAVTSAVKAKFPTINCATEYVNMPESFPHLSLFESDNSVTTNHRDNSENEYATITYEVSIYADGAGKKSVCKSIAKIVDEKMRSLNFTREMAQALPNIDGDVFRYMLRYSAETDGTNIYRI